MLEKMYKWLDDPRMSIGVRLLYGPGGQGKTRLAGKLAELSASAGWTVAEASSIKLLGLTDDIVGEQQLSVTGRGLLIVVDYGERWPTNDLRTLIVQHRRLVRVPLRVLVLARPAGLWWQSIVDTLDHFSDPEIHADAFALPPMAESRHAREEVFNSARDAFAEALRVRASDIRAPDDLDRREFRLLLAIHMAALASVHAHLSGERLPTDPDGLSAYLLRRERQEWEAIHARDPNFTEPAVMAQATFLATLTRSVSYEDGLSLLSRTHVATAVETGAKVLRDHAICYPPAAPGMVLEPLFPDRLGEDFIALQMPGHDVSYPIDAHWTPTAIDWLLDLPETQQPTGHAPEIMTVLVEVARRWPHIARDHLWPALRLRPSLATAAGPAALTRLLTIPEIDYVALAAISDYMTDPDIELYESAARIEEVVAEHRLAQKIRPADRANALLNLGRKRLDAGYVEEAYEATSAAIKLYNELNRPPADYAAELGNALTQAGIELLKLGRLAEARDVSSRTIEMLQHSAFPQAETAVALGQSFTTLGSALHDLGELEGGLEAFTEALRIRRGLGASVSNSQTLVAAALLNISILLQDQSRWDDSKSHAAESIRLYREAIGAGHRGGGRIGLARSLHSLARARWFLGEADESIKLIREAVEVSLDLAEFNHETAEELGGRVRFFRACLDDAGRVGDASALTEKAIQLFEMLANDHGLPAASNSLGQLLGSVGRHEEAVIYSRRALADFRRSANEHSPRDSTEMAMTLLSLNLDLWKLGRERESHEAIQQLLDVCREHDAAEYTKDLDYLCHHLTSTGQYETALAVVAEYAGILQTLVARGADEYRPQLAAARELRVEVLGWLGRQREVGTDTP
ncbi:tetratricopeptide repeat protein [Asanoa ferruginea]|uniref:tetratricopeptide repeat protein n=1 Tax=Asanoa ferruginea TaxID=53367 RepID=UPI0014773F26|nr:tetratricopeptide repeat protein [Asanoa ferruginea]